MTHTRMLVLTIRQGEERGMCSAALWELLRVVRDQIGTLQREKQLKYTDVEVMRVITNDRHIATQIKSDLALSVQGAARSRLP